MDLISMKEVVTKGIEKTIKEEYPNVKETTFCTENDWEMVMKVRTKEDKENHFRISIDYGCEAISKEKWIENQLKQFPRADEKILTFIANMGCHSQFNRVSDVEAIRYLFHAGYCYHFAVILKEMFGGTITWHKGFSHIVWTNDKVITKDSIFYDIEGVFYDYADDEMVPATVLGDELEYFKHR